MLPGISIEFQNGNLGQITSTADGVFGLLASAVEVTDTFELEKAYQIRSMKDVALMGIKPDVDNYVLHKTLREFYAEAGEGTELWLMGIDKAKPVSSWFKPNEETGVSVAKDLLNAAKGKLSALFTCYDPSATVTIENGLDADVFEAMSLAQQLSEDYTKEYYSPFIVLLEGYGFTGDKIALPDLKESGFNRVGIVIGDSKSSLTEPKGKGASIGVIAGRLAKIQVSINIGRVRDGALKPLQMFIGETPVEQFDVTALHDKGYITFRFHQGRSGYFISDDPLATSENDDYRYISRRRTIDKAYRLVYATLLDFLLDSAQVMPNGAINPIYAKVIENAVESAIQTSMTANSELSNDSTNPNDRGVICRVDLDHNLVSTGEIKMTAQVRPLGYNRFINVELGYMPINIE